MKLQVVLNFQIRALENYTYSLNYVCCSFHYIFIIHTYHSTYEYLPLYMANGNRSHCTYIYVSFLLVWRHSKTSQSGAS